MKSLTIGMLLFGILTAVGIAVAQQRIDGGQATHSYEIEPGGTRVNRANGDGGAMENVRAVQSVRVCVVGTTRCNNREIVCTSGSTATLDGKPIVALPTALASFCEAILGPAPNFVTRRNAMLNAAGVKALLVGP